MNRNLIVAVLVIGLILSLGVNTYLITQVPIKPKPASGTAYVSMLTNGYPLELVPPSQIGVVNSIIIETLNGSAMVTCVIIASAPVNFYIYFDGGIYVYSALNVTNLHANVALPEGSWPFEIAQDGVVSNVSTAWLLINYTYFALLNKPQ
jgi:hypothetical protein